MLSRTDILTVEDGEPVAVDNPDGAGRFLFICEHASRLMPRNAGNLGLGPEALASHIAWDPGALAVASQLSSEFDSVLISQRFSRLIYDCNRPPESPSAMPEASEIYEIPGNKNLAPAERYARTAALYIPFHDRIAQEVAARKARRQDTIVVTVHSFTPVYLGKQRDVEVGILHDEDSRFADALLDVGKGGQYRLERNDPYGPDDGVTHSLRLHALPNGLMNVMIEVRNDLLADEAGQGQVSAYLTSLFCDGLSRLGAAS
ncbi:N-formylglutamate amidohydrolase [Agrobacterium sp. ES01]|uniref:N-formylglutamate amidohydrolase n=1 Tax=Agrobacterium sp. ES01 TaxID=3420714 RepID=UPI003D0E4226